MKWTKLPKKKGRIEIYAEFVDQGVVGVVIMGTPDGLRYLAKILNQLADCDQEASDYPDDAREHYHLIPGRQIGAHSCNATVYRADAKGTGVLPNFMNYR